MPLVTLKEILPEARRQKRAVGAFNVANVEAAMGVIRAAEGEKLPAIIQIFQRLFLTEKGSDLAGALLRMAHRCSQPIVVHLDHGGSPEIVRAALAAGTTSVMFDGSTLPFEKNVELTRYAADYAHTLGASCEGEIGHVSMGDENAIQQLRMLSPSIRQPALTPLPSLLGLFTDSTRPSRKSRQSAARKSPRLSPEFRSYCTAARERPRKIFKRS